MVSPINSRTSSDMHSLALQHIPLADTIQEKEPTPFTTSKPSLSLPLAVIDQSERLNKLSDSWTRLHLDALQQKCTEMEQLELEKINNINEAAKRSIVAKFWDTLSTIASCILSAVYTFFGYTVLTLGMSPLIGGALIGTGILTLANTICSHIGIWDKVATYISKENEEMQARLSTLIPAVIGITSALIGAAALGRARRLVDISQNPMNHLTKAIQLNEGITAADKTYSDSKEYAATIKSLKIEKDLFLNKRAIDKHSDDINSFLEHQSTTYDQATKIIQASQQMNEIALRG